MYDDLVLHHPPLLSPSLLIPFTILVRAALPIRVQGSKVLRVHTVAGAGGVELLLAGMEEVGDAQAEGAALVPAAVGEGWVVGGWGGEVPLLVGGIEAGPVSG